MKRHHSSLVLGLVVTLCAGALSQRNDGPAFEYLRKYHVTGMGGAGGMFQPAVSPWDPKLMFLACDMSGTYRSTDGGKSWAMMHYGQLSNSLGCRPLILSRTIYWADGGTLKVSRDAGASWSKLVQGPQPWKTGVSRIAAPAGEVVVVGAGDGLYVSHDAGRTWDKARDGAVHDVATLGEDVYASVGEQVMASADLGKTWNPIDLTMPDKKPVLGLSAAVVKNSVLYAVNQSGIARSTDKGKTWQVVNDKVKCNVVLVPENQTAVAWATSTQGGKDVYRTDDGGKTWANVFRMEVAPQNVEKAWVQTVITWSYGILGFNINPADPNTAMVSTQGDFYITRDGGKTWQQLMNAPVAGEANRFRSIGLEVTSCWQYAVDPSDDNRHYIAYTDIGFARSADGGQTWSYAATGSPWRNTFYQIAFDPAVKGRIYAACSNVHDIPHYGYTAPLSGGRGGGGVCVSDDHGMTWKVLGKGLPALPCTSLALDPKTSGEKLTMYVTLYEGGVFKSADAGQTWVKKSNGLGNEGNNHAFMVKVHPKTGALFCSITALRKGREYPSAGGIWKSTDGGESWTDLTKELKLAWPTGFAVDPSDENVIYLAASTGPERPEGGVYKSADGGKTWKHVIDDQQIAGPGGFSHCMFMTLHPDHPEWVYLSSGTHGLWLSKDSGQTWKHFDDFPFRSITRLVWDPKDKGNMHITTFGGGAWHGPDEP